MNKIKVLSIFGTRPEAIKMAPIVLKMEEDDAIESIVCVTAQHREMLDQVLDLFKIVPDYDLDIMQKNQTLTQITARALEKLDGVISDCKPDIILVHGDTTTTFVGALAAFYQQVKIGHVEAGLRTYNKYAPFPEEINRRLTTNVTDIHFAPTELNRKNLNSEGIADNTIYTVGNSVIDALLFVANKPYEFEEPVLKKLDFETKRVVTVTCHRRENLGENMENIFSALHELASEFSDIEIVYPVHLNPKVRDIANRILEKTDRVHLIEPLEYQPFVNLLAKSHILITDSGGIQEEAPSLGKPVLVVREETERPEAIEAGTIKLAGVKKESIVEKAKALLTNRNIYESMSKASNPYGNGTSSDQIVDIIKKEITKQ